MQKIKFKNSSDGKRANQHPSFRNGGVQRPQILVYSPWYVAPTNNISICWLLRKYFSLQICLPRTPAIHLVIALQSCSQLLHSLPTHRCKEPEWKVVTVEFRNKASLPISYSSHRDNLNIEALCSQSGKLSLPALERCRETILIQGMAHEKQNLQSQKKCTYTCLKWGWEITSHIVVSFLFLTIEKIVWIDFII